MPAGSGKLAAVVALMTLTASACGGPAPAEESTSVTTSTPALAPSPTPTAQVVTAADGTDLSACEDGTCEVRIDEPSSVDVDERFMVGLLGVESIGETTVTLRLEGVPGEAFGFACDHPSCSMSVVGQSAVAPASGQGSVSTGARLTVNELAIEVVAIFDGSAVLSLSPVDG